MIRCSFCVALLGCALLAGCAGDGVVVDGKTATTVAKTTRFYSVDATDHLLLQYAPDGSGGVTLGQSVSLPAELTGQMLIAVDASGRVYVGGATTDSSTTEVVVYPTGLSGSTPLRTVGLEPGKLTALAVDAAGQIYAGQLNVAGSVKVYSAGAAGASAAVRVINPGQLQFVSDIAVDGPGNVYVSAYNGSRYEIDEFAASAMGAVAPVRTLTAPANSYFGGIAVDDSGNLFAMEQLTIVEFGPTAVGTPLPDASINLPGPVAPFTQEAYSNVLRRSATGDLVVPVVMSGGGGSSNVVLAYRAGNAVPLLQFVAAKATESTPLGINVPLGAF